MKKYFFFTASLLLLSAVFLTAFSTANETPLVSDVHMHTNAFRESNGLKPLQLNQELTELAQEHSQKMASGEVSFGHDGFNQRSDLAYKANPRWRSVAENVAVGQTTAFLVVESWKKSTGHRKNMLGNFSYIGIGIAKAKDGTIYYTQIFGGY
jgi:uncharacterized protein YkwD